MFMKHCININEMGTIYVLTYAETGFLMFADALNCTLINMFRPGHEIKKKK